jgi:5,10-methylenetetrahydromethanopterin reductase
VPLPKFGLNRFDARSVHAFAEDVKRAELLGWDAAFQPDSQLRRRDTYVLLAAAAQATERIALAPFIANPVTRQPSVTASSIATVDELAPGRVILALGIGDTAVRLSGLRPARVAELESATLTIKALSLVNRLRSAPCSRRTCLTTGPCRCGSRPGARGRCAWPAP